MTVQFIVGFTVLLFALTLIAEPISRWLHLPLSAVLVLLGVGVTYFVTLGLGVDTGLRAKSFLQPIILLTRRLITASPYEHIFIMGYHKAVSLFF